MSARSAVRAARLLPTAILVATGLLAQTTNVLDTEIEHPGTIEPVPALVVTNAQGFRLSFVRRGDASVVGLFELSRRPELLDAERGVELVFPDGSRRQTARLDGSISWLEFPLWDGRGAAEDAPLRDLMEIPTIEVAYFLEGGGYKSTVFELDGLAAAAAATYSIPETVAPEARRAAAVRRQLLDDAAVRCSELKRRRREECLEAVRSCAAAAESALQGGAAADPEQGALRECLTESGG
ncbi:MAG: hypothetical protein DWQ36_25510 [Acidobacteria bacterium]|nr:MAG: hypothetical protein DWQ30_04460 [Acidobacteriota bacterium]REJ99373.1 MAG: hypothetical protein DWQ36_25510 [Acidobacteriota bacterium]